MLNQPPIEALEQQAAARQANNKLIAEALRLLSSGADAVSEGALNISEAIGEILHPELSDEV